MTEQEVRNLKVGDMVLFYDPGVFGPRVYAEEVKGITYGVDMGLILENDGKHVRVEWFSEEVNTVFIIGHRIWNQVKKA